eukprot:13390327-Heterocapsa_arctica.AAC.1
MLREHPPGILSLVHPMFGDVDYGVAEEDEYKILTIVVNGKDQHVQVYAAEGELNSIRRVWYLLQGQGGQVLPVGTRP